MMNTVRNDVCNAVTPAVRNNARRCVQNQNQNQSQRSSTAVCGVSGSGPIHRQGSSATHAWMAAPRQIVGQSCP